MTKATRADIQVDTSTRHDIRIVMPDSSLEGIDSNDDVYIHLAGRGKEVVKKLTWGDIQKLLTIPDDYSYPRAQPLKNNFNL